MKYWNNLIKIRDNKNTPYDVANMAGMLLRQLNTASNDLIFNEVEKFYLKNKYYEQS